MKQTLKFDKKCETFSLSQIKSGKGLLTCKDKKGQTTDSVNLEAEK